MDGGLSYLAFMGIGWLLNWYYTEPKTCVINGYEPSSRSLMYDDVNDCKYVPGSTTCDINGTVWITTDQAHEEHGNYVDGVQSDLFHCYDTVQLTNRSNLKINKD